MIIYRDSIPPITTPDDPDGIPVPRRLYIAGRPITLYLEIGLWNALERIADEKKLTLAQLCGDIAGVTAPDASFVEAARCFVFGHIADQIPDDLLPAELRDFRRRAYYPIN